MIGLEINLAKKSRQFLHDNGGILKTCQDIHSYIKGTNDTCEHLKQKVEALKYIKDGWVPPDPFVRNHEEAIWEDAVYQLIEATIAEGELYLKETENA